MRVTGRVLLLGLAVCFATAFGALAADAPPLLKPVTPGGGQVRVRMPITPGFPKTMQFTAQVPNGKKKSELLNVAVAFDTLPGQSYITTKKLESWGYTPNGKEFLLPELLLSMSQIAPKTTKGTDVAVRLTNVKLTVVESPASSDNSIYFCDMSLSASSLYGGFERTMEPRLSFGDKFLELTVPPAVVKRLGTENLKAPEITTNPDATLVASAAPTLHRGGRTVFAYAAINGQDSYKTPNGVSVPVNVTVSSINNWKPGIVVSIGLARGCKVEMDQAAAGMMGTGVDGKTEMIPGKLKELRLGLLTGTGLKTQKDIVLKDVPVVVDKNISEGVLYIGQKFIDTYFPDGVYAADSNGWKLHGRVKPDLLFDIKTRLKK